ncbi:hypothetical protein [Streptomyces caniscabiei]|uniref:hypothetical protein n=1 Tax=Streptomyces caniscabiei TaxID=2746961 RepID=UPI0007659793|nr:hypothetical protein [Streptomyces caniscabiei]
MAPTKAPPALTQTPAEPALGLFYNVRNAAIRLGLTDPKKPNSTTGQRWLRDGFNRPLDGSKGRKFPGRYMGRELIFSEADLAVIDEIAREETEERLRAKERMPVSTGRPRRARRTAKAPARAAA